jgi:hypothetical protein
MNGDDSSSNAYHFSQAIANDYYENLEMIAEDDEATREESMT